MNYGLEAGGLQGEVSVEGENHRRVESLGRAATIACRYDV